MSREVVIRGVGTSHFGAFPEKRVEELAWEAAVEALEDAATERSELGAFLVGSVFGPPGIAARVGRGLGIGSVPAYAIEAACASGTAAFHEAVTGVADGRFDCALVLGVEQLSTLFSGAIVPEATDPEGATGLPLPGLYALQAERYRHLYGLDDEQLAAVAVKNKRHGLRNPRAHLAAELTVGEVLESRMIAEPLTLLQCCPTSDGAGALVVSTARGEPGEVRVRASALVSGEPWDHRNPEEWGRLSVARAAEQAYAQAGVSAEEIDLFEVHDAFTIGEIITLEALGIAPSGEGASLAVSGHTAFGGAQPVNASGGLLSRGHPLGATGTAQIAEMAWQLRGHAGERQVAGAELGLVETMGGGAAGMDGNACVVTVLSKS
ncbi:MAG TPA: thiolase family protein [Solirubrobacteraceae bacterium]|jgi:acetyl-CoA C-acetyltransferase|nr:thiolase family protein [Solirubrobacteraceae bacterium]